jgi:MFS family permease
MPALASAAYRRFIFGALLSNVGSWMQATAQGWLVLGLTNSATALGVTSAATNLPVLLFSLYAGALADRVDQRRLLVMTQAMAAVFTAVLAVLTMSGAVQFWHVLVIAFLVGSMMALSSPAYQALVSTLVDARALGNAIALNSAQFNLSRIVGPAFAGFGIALGGIALSFWANALSFVVVVIVLATLPIRNSRAIGRLEASLWSNIGDGLRYARSAPVVPALLLLTVAPALLNLNYLVFLPIFARDVLGVGAPGLGLMTSAVGIGALGGALTVAVARPGGGSGRLVIAALAASSTGLLIFSVSTWLPLSLVGLAILGACQVAYYATTNTLLQLLVPPRLRGRVMSLYILASTGFTPFGNLIMGPIADRIGVQLTLAICALTTIVICGAVALRSRGLRSLHAARLPHPA